LVYIGLLDGSKGAWILGFKAGPMVGLNAPGFCHRFVINFSSIIHLTTYLYHGISRGKQRSKGEINETLNSIHHLNVSFLHQAAQGSCESAESKSSIFNLK
jgi:hypothetical protein